ncbi:MAG: ECF transporter S component [Candidatus Thorarchaeota archaeon]|nr:MAG: ECF transporter S component [Candidatus Thorarchaeota archaeon]
MEEYSAPEKQNPVFYIALIGVLTALTTAVTAVLVIPFPTTSGYLNIGDTVVMTSGLMLGPAGAFFVGGVGSAMVDAVVAPQYAPITLIVKGCEGLVIALVSRSKEPSKRLRARDALALVCGAVVMLTGYFVGETWLLMLGIGPALLELVGVNSIQVTVGVLVAAAVGPVLRDHLRQLG